MVDLIEAVLEIVGSVLEEALKDIKDPKKRKWALTRFYSAVTLAIAVILLLVFGFSIIRGHKRGWKQAGN